MRYSDREFTKHTSNLLKIYFKFSNQISPCDSTNTWGASAIGSAHAHTILDLPFALSQVDDLCPRSQKVHVLPGTQRLETQLSL